MMPSGELARANNDGISKIRTIRETPMKPLARLPQHLIAT